MAVSQVSRSAEPSGCQTTVAITKSQLSTAGLQCETHNGQLKLILCCRKTAVQEWEELEPACAAHLHLHRWHLAGLGRPPGGRLELAMAPRFRHSLSRWKEESHLRSAPLGITATFISENSSQLFMRVETSAENQNAKNEKIS